MNLQITGLYAGLLGLFFLFLSFQVVKARRKNAISLGDGNIDELQKAIRAHANFAEYTPICLLLLAIGELTSFADVFLHVCGALLLYGRVAHAFGLITKSGPSWGRVSGMLATFASLLALSVWNIFVVVTKIL